MKFYSSDRAAIAVTAAALSLAIAVSFFVSQNTGEALLILLTFIGTGAALVGAYYLWRENRVVPQPLIQTALSIRGWWTKADHYRCYLAVSVQKNRTVELTFLEAPGFELSLVITKPIGSGAYGHYELPPDWNSVVYVGKVIVGTVAERGSGGVSFDLRPKTNGKTPDLELLASFRDESRAKKTFTITVVPSS